MNERIANGDTVCTFSVRGDTQAVQVTGLDLQGVSTTRQFTKDGTYKLVRVADQDK
jgi:hypothetical protein